MIYRILIDALFFSVGMMYGGTWMFYVIRKKFILPYQKLTQAILDGWKMSLDSQMDMMGIRSDGSIRSPIQMKK